MNTADIKRWSDSTLFLGTDITHWLLALAAALLAYLVATWALRFALQRLQRMATHSRTTLDDAAVQVLSGTNRILIAVAALLIGVNLLDLPDRWATRVSQLWFVAVALQLALWGGRAIRIGLDRYLQRHAPNSAAHASASATLMSWGLHTALWSMVTLAILSNLGVDITAFVASLGVGGIAVALAVQNVLGDLFASLSIAIDKPFEVGDFIAFDSVSGTVEHVGLKSTRIRSLSGEQVVVSNTDLLKQTLSNYKRQAQRRVQFGFGLTYDTTPDQAERIAGVARRIIEQRPKLKFDRAHFKGFGDSSLDFEVVYFVTEPDYTLYMDEQQLINLALMRELGRMGVSFAFPTRTVILSGVQEAAALEPLARAAPTRAH
jgi:small-conductance mechanosensitive channel